MMTNVLAAMAVVSAGLTVGFDAGARRKAFYVLKPLTMVLVILIAALAGTPVPAAYRTLILAGLVVSLAGDVFLMFPERWFQAGLVSFLVAQVLYVLAFRPEPGGGGLSAPVLLPFLLYALLFFRMLAPGLGKLKLPVLVYTAAITLMAWLAACRFVYLGGTKPLIAFVGAVLFLISDSVLAYDRFSRKVGAAQIIILGTYFPAQLLIAMSV
jgi:uncharacterized membrane protein YhhN